LAFASLLLAFSNAKAKDFSTSDGNTYSGEIEATGTIHVGSSRTLYMNYSSLGNAWGGRFSLSADEHYSVLMLNNTALYIVGPNNIPLSIYVQDNSLLVSDNDIGLRNYNIPYYGINVSNNSILIAPRVEALGIQLLDNSYGEFRAEADIMEIKNSTWISTGTSIIGTCTAQNATVELLMGNALDAIYITDVLHLSGSINIKYNLTNDFIESIMAGDGYFDIFRSNTIVGSIDTSATPTVSGSVSETNGTYTWIVTDLSGGYGVNFRVSDFVLIPEPSTYAAIFGVIALAFVAYKRRK